MADDGSALRDELGSVMLMEDIPVTADSYASDPESIGTGCRARRLGLPASSRLLLPRWRSPMDLHGDVTTIADRELDRKPSDGKRTSAGRKFSAMLRRSSTHSINVKPNRGGRARPRLVRSSTGGHPSDRQHVAITGTRRKICPPTDTRMAHQNKDGRGSSSADDVIGTNAIASTNSRAGSATIGDDQRDFLSAPEADNTSDGIIARCRRKRISEPAPPVRPPHGPSAKTNESTTNGRCGASAPGTTSARSEEPCSGAHPDKTQAGEALPATKTYTAELAGKIDTNDRALYVPSSRRSRDKAGHSAAPDQLEPSGFGREEDSPPSPHGRRNSISRRRRLAELLPFRRRGHSAASGTGSTIEGNGHDLVLHKEEPGSSTDDGPDMIPPRSGSAPPVVDRTGLEDKTRRSLKTEDDARNTSTGVQIFGRRRRLNPRRSTNSSTPSKSQSLIEAGRHKLRRGRHRLGRAAFRSTHAAENHQGDGPNSRSDDAPGFPVEPGRRQSDVSASTPEALRQAELSRKPRLGTTYSQRVATAPLDDDVRAPWNTWGRGDAREFRVRTRGYAKSRLKEPSEPALYQLVSVDAYRSKGGRICDVFPLFEPPLTEDITGDPALGFAGGGHGDVSEAAKILLDDGSSNATGNLLSNGDQHVLGNVHDQESSEGEQVDAADSKDGSAIFEGDFTGHEDIPAVFVVNCQLPDTPTPFTAAGDGPTIHVVFAFRATKRLCRYAALLHAEERKAEMAIEQTQKTNKEPWSPTGNDNGEPNRGEPESSARETDNHNSDAADKRSGTMEANVADMDVANGLSDARRHGEEPSRSEVIPPSVTLLAQWMKLSSEDSTFRGRFKAIGDVINADEVGLPSIARRFSGKPVLVYGKESTMVRRDGYAELDLNAHAFSYLGRKGLYITLDKWKTAIFRIGFLIEARTDDEQPEHILGCGVLKGLDMNMLPSLSRSADGERLVVRNPGEADYVDGDVRHSETENTEAVPYSSQAKLSGSRAQRASPVDREAATGIPQRRGGNRGAKLRSWEAATMSALDFGWYMALIAVMCVVCLQTLSESGVEATANTSNSWTWFLVRLFVDTDMT